jgi:hypothetical protein
MSRQFFNDGMEITNQDLSNISPSIEREFYDGAIHEIVQRTSDAFFGESFKVSYISPTQIQVANGLGIQNDSLAVSPEPSKKPLFLQSSQSVNLQAADGSLDRIDIVCVKYNQATEATESRKYKAPITGTITTESFVTRKSKVADILIVTGVPNASPSVPATPSGYIKIAEMLVSAVVGLSGVGAITDTRTIMPLGGALALNTLGYSRLTANAATPISTLIAEIEQYLITPYFNYVDIDVLTSDPVAPDADKVRIYHKSGVLYSRDEGGIITPIGTGGGGGAGASWYDPEGYAPLTSEENGQQVSLFSQNGEDKHVLWVKVPNSYLSGRQIKLNLTAYSPSSSNEFLMRTTTTLIRKNNDAVTSTTNQRVSTNTALTNAVANQMREIQCDLTSPTGTINSVVVSAGDMLKIELTRASDTDTADVRFVKSATEMLVS